MADNVEKRVVKMEFDNSKFDKNVKKSSKTLDEFKKELQFKDVSKNMDTVCNKFKTMEIVAYSVINNITNRVVNLGVQLIKSLSIDNISSGWTKFGQKTVSVATIMAQSVKVAGKELSNYNDRLEAVNDQLEKLNWFTDETSYNFNDMVNTIGKFTAAGQDLDVSVKAMMGIANWAALSGQNAMVASRAMEQLAQTLGRGYVQLQDWRSIQNANMDTQEFRDIVLSTAESLGQLTKKGNEFVSKTGKKITSLNFADTLGDKWFTSDVLVKSLEKYSAAVEKVYEISSETGKTASEVMELYADELDDFGLKAFKAAQEARTLSDAITSVKDAVSTGWMNTAEKIFGSYDESKDLWTDLANELYDVFAEGGNFRNDILKIWSDLAGRSDLFKHGGSNQGAFWNLYDSIIELSNKVKSAWNNIFPKSKFEAYDDIIKDLANGFKLFTSNIQRYTERVKKSLKENQKIQYILEGIFNVCKMIITVINGIRYAIDPLITVINNLASILFDRLAFILRDVSQLQGFAEGVEKVAKRINNVLTSIISIARSGIEYVIDGIKFILSEISKFGSFMYTNISGFFSSINETDEEILESVESSAYVKKEIDKNGTPVEAMTNYAERTTSATIGLRKALLVEAEELDAVNEEMQDNTKKTFTIFDALKSLGESLVIFAKGVLSLMTGAIVMVSNVFSFIGGILKAIGDFITDIFKNGLNWSHVTIILGLAAIILAIVGGVILVKNLIYSLQSVINPIAYNLTNVSDSLYEISASKKFSSIAEMIKSIGESLLMVAIAMAIIGSLDTGAFIRASITIGLLVAIFASIIIALKIIDKQTKEGGKTVNSVVKGFQGIGQAFEEVKESWMEGTKMYAIASIIKSIGLAMMLIGIAFQLIGNLTWEQWGRAMIALGVFVGLMAGFVVLSDKFGKEADADRLKAFSKVILAYAVAFRLIASTVSTLGKMDTSSMWQGVAGFTVAATAFVGLIIAIDTITKLTTKTGVIKEGDQVVSTQTLNIVKVMIALGSAMLLIAHIIKMLGNMDPNSMWQGVAGFTVAATAFVGLIIAIDTITKLMTKQKVIEDGESAIEKQTNGLIKIMISLSSSFLIIAHVIKMLGNMDTSSMWQGVAALSVISILFSSMVLGINLLIAQMAKSSALQDGESAIEKQTNGLIKIMIVLSASLLAISLVIKVLLASASGDIELLYAALGAFAIVTALLSGLIMVFVGASALMSKFNIDPSNMITLAISLGIMAGSLTLLGLALKIFEGMNILKTALGLLTLSAAIAALALVAKLLGSVLATFNGFSVATLALGAGLLLAVLAMSLFGEQLTAVAINIVENSGVIGEALIAIGQQLTTALLETLKTALSGIAEIIPQIAELIISLVDGIASVISEAAPRITEILTSLILMVLDVIHNTAPQLISTVIEVILLIINALAENMGSIIGALVTLIVNLVKELALQLGPKIPEILGYLIILIIDIIKGILNYIVPLAGAIAEVILTLIAFAINVAIQSLGALGKLLLTFLTSIILLIVNLIDGLANVILSALELILVNLVKLLNKALAFVGEMIPVMLASGFSAFIGGILKGFVDILDSVHLGWIADAIGLRSASKTMLEAADSMVDFVGVTMETVMEEADDAMNNISNVMTWSANNIADTVNEAFDNIGEAVSDTVDHVGEAFSGIGENIGSGLAGGVNASTDEAVDAIDNMVEQTTEEAEEGYGIASPSKVFARIGKYVVEGFANGVEQGTPEATNSIADCVNDAIETAQSIISDDMDDNIVIRPIMDLSAVNSGASSISSMMSSISGRSVSIGTELANATSREINRKQAADVNKNQNGSNVVTNEGDVYNATFNVVTNDPEELARQADILMQKSRMMKNLAKGGAK